MAIGYACIAIGVPGAQLAGCTLRTAEEERLRSVIEHNLGALEHICAYNIAAGIRLFRISSDLIPFGSHEVNGLHWWQEYAPRLAALGADLRASGTRVSMHPGQYTVLSSPDEAVAQRAMADLEYHGRVLDALGVDATHRLILHIGGTYGDKPAAMARFCRRFAQLPPGIRHRLSLENDERQYHIADVLDLCQRLGVPAVFDTLHHGLHPAPGGDTAERWMARCAATWTVEQGAPKIHYSQQQPGAPAGAHSATIALEPFLRFYDILPAGADVMLEVKDKNLSALKCIHATTPDLPVEVLEAQWARYGVLVLSHSAAIHREVSALLQDKSKAHLLEFYDLIQRALALPEDRGAQINAAEHVWGHERDAAQPAETKRYQRLLEEYRRSGTLAPLKRHLLRMASQQGVHRLLWSLYFYID